MVMTLLSFGSLVAIGWFLINNVEWFKAHIFEVVDPKDEDYMTYVMHMQNSLLKRCVGLFSGFALIFVGSSVSIYVAKRITQVGADAKDFKFSLTTASPGIIAMLLGGAILMFTIQSKDEFSGYDGSSAAEKLDLEREAAYE